MEDNEEYIKTLGDIYLIAITNSMDSNTRLKHISNLIKTVMRDQKLACVLALSSETEQNMTIMSARIPEEKENK
jgi:tRNA U34 5-methylaminomethyl-2-thiouridine-forming methyltransferase MnmC